MEEPDEFLHGFRLQARRHTMLMERGADVGWA
jgi:hypothetical protein